MPRPKYRITNKDYNNASQYLSYRVRNYEIEFDEDAPDPDGDFLKANDSFKHSKKELVEKLNAWCEQYLSTAEWTKLKSAIRKRRERLERYNDLTTITISTKAHEYLVKVAEQEEATFTEVLEHYLPKAYRAAPRNRMKKRR